MEECLRFAEEQGIVKGEELGNARKMMRLMQDRGGPGGCKGPEECRTYCEDPGHHTECFKWAHENEVIPPEALDRMKEEVRRMLEGMPEEVRACVQDALGEDFIGKLEAGHIPPGPEFFGKVRVCFERFGFQGHGPSFFPTEEEAPEFVACLKKVLGPEEFEELRKSGRPPGPEIAERVHECAVAFGPGRGPMTEGQMMPGRPPMGGFMHDAPPEVIACAKGAIGEDKFRELQEGKAHPERAIFDRMHKCFEEFQKDFAPPSPVTPGLPPDVEVCVKRILGVELFQKLHNKEIVPDPAIFERTKICFEHLPPRPPMPGFSPRLPMPGISPGAFPRPAPVMKETVFTCLMEAVGKEMAEQIRQGMHPAPEIMETARRCFGTLQFSPAPAPESGVCPTDFAPVCGSDKKTYTNRCFASKAGVAISHFGSCEGTAPSPIYIYPSPSPHVGPGGCLTFEGCKQYCSDPAHFEECSKYPEFAPSPPQSVLQRFLQAAIRLLTR